MPHDLIFLTLEGVPFLGTFDRCYNPPHGTMIAARRIPNNICVNELRSEPKVDYTHLFTTQKAWMHCLPRGDPRTLCASGIRLLATCWTFFVITPR